MYRIATTDPITGKSLTQLIDMPFVIEEADEDRLVIYFESEQSRELYLQKRGERERESGLETREN